MEVRQMPESVIKDTDAFVVGTTHLSLNALKEVVCSPNFGRLPVASLLVAVGVAAAAAAAFCLSK